MSYRVLCCGDRNWKDRAKVRLQIQALRREHPDLIVIEGEAPGADTLCREVAEEMEIPVEKHPANWKRFGRAAGRIRNQEMLDTGVDFALAFHSNLAASRGTKDMVRKLTRAGVPVRGIK